MSEYLVVYEKTGMGYGAYIPDLPGCVAAGTSLEEAERLIGEAVPLHLELMRESGETIPLPTTLARHISVQVPSAIAA